MSSGRIYLDNCMTTMPAPEVLAAMQPYLTEKFWYPGSFVSTGETINEALNQFKGIVAKSLSAKPTMVCTQAAINLTNTF